MDNKQPTKKISTGGDRISMLPEDIIHNILYGLRSTKQVVQCSILSKTWVRLVQSYPIDLEFHHTDKYAPGKSQRTLAAALLKKFSTVKYVLAIRIKIAFCSKDFYPKFLDRVLDLASNFSLLREIDIKFGGGCYYYKVDSPGYAIPKSFFTPNGKQFANLNILKLEDCSLYLYKNLGSNFSCLGSSLKVLCLERVYFSDGIVDSMIEHASLLETLTLKNIKNCSWKLRIRNHPNLKVLKAEILHLDLLEIGGIHSLKEVDLIGISWTDFKMWSTPNLKVLQLHSCQVNRSMPMEIINKLISELPLLESLTLQFPRDGTRELKIVHSEKLREVTLMYPNRHQTNTVEIHAPMLTKFTYQGNCWFFPVISTSNPVGSNEVVAASVRCEISVGSLINVRRLKQFLIGLSRFQWTVAFSFDISPVGVPPVMPGPYWDEDQDKTPPPAVECLKLQANRSVFEHARQHTYLDGFFRCCHPKLVCFTEWESEQVSNLENVCKEIMERDCETGCSCWRHQLKDVKMVNRVASESTSVERDKVLENSMDTVSSLGEVKQEVWFTLTWH